MSARSTFLYNSDARLRNVIDTAAVELAGIIEGTYEVNSMTEIPQIPEALRKTLRFYLTHGICILVKHDDEVNSETYFSQMHPDFNDLKINMEPSPRLTISRFIPRIQREEKIVLGSDKFRVYRGGIADMDFQDLLTFLGYTSISTVS